MPDAERARNHALRRVDWRLLAGVPAPGLTLSPPVAGAKWLAKNPRGTGAADDLGRTRCLTESYESWRLATHDTALTLLRKPLLVYNRLSRKIQWFEAECRYCS